MNCFIDDIIYSNMKYAFVVLAILAVWLGAILLAIFNPGVGLFLPIFMLVMTVILFVIGFRKKV